MTLIDTHTHLYLKDFKDDIDEVISRAMMEGVDKFYLPAIDSGELKSMINLEEKYPGKCFAMNGLHPCSVKENFEYELGLVHDGLSKRKFAGVGEIGLDFYWGETFKKQQYIALEQQLQWGLEFKLPVILHTRNAIQQTIETVKPFADKGLKGIFHCFGGSIQNAREIIKMGFYLGIGGVLTYKNSGLLNIIQELDCEHLVLETDSPYLTPVPFRGKRNESSYIKLIALKLSEVLHISMDEVARITTRNANKIFT